MPSAAALPLVLAASALATLPMQSAPGSRDKLACAVAYERAQLLRNQDHLRAARDQLAVCARASCPTSASADCTRWLGEVEQSTPTVVVEAYGAGGHERYDVKVTFDGAPLVDHLDGRAVAVDPGVHVFRFEAGGATREQQLAVHEGEKNRRIVVSFDGASPTAPVPQPVTVVSPGSSSSSSSSSAARVPPATFVLGAVAVIGVAGFTFFGLSGVARENDLRNSCSPHCTSSEIDGARSRYVTADVSLTVGVVAAAAAAAVYLLSPRGGGGNGSAAGAGARATAGSAR